MAKRDIHDVDKRFNSALQLFNDAPITISIRAYAWNLSMIIVLVGMALRWGKTER